MPSPPRCLSCDERRVVPLVEAHKKGGQHARQIMQCRRRMQRHARWPHVWKE